MMLIKRFLAGNEVRLIMQDLAHRHRIRQEGGRQWAENVGTLFPQAQRYYELLEAATAALPSEADRQAMLEAAWKEFRQLAIKLSPLKAQWPSRRLGDLDTNWTWIAFDNRGKAIRVDPHNGQPLIVTMKAAKQAAGLDIKALSWTSTHPR